MYTLRELVQTLRTELKKIEKGKRFKKSLIAKILKNYDLKTLERGYKSAVDGSIRMPYATKEREKIREANPGLYAVIFVNRSTKERQVLTKPEGIPYDVALDFYNYVTFFGSEKYNDVGYYDIIKTGIQLPEESHFGVL